MAHKFDDLLFLMPDGGVDARGPKEPGDEILELCAWVYQRGECGEEFQRGDNDAAATEMTTLKPELKADLMPDGISGERWHLPLGRIPEPPAPAPALEPGAAFAIAVSLLKTVQGKQRLVWWGHPVTLEGPSGS
jgi:hypothetical protein